MHLTVRVAWHDNRWNGRVCRHPKENVACTMLEEIRLKKDEAQEEANRDRLFRDLDRLSMPPCVEESGTFMSLQPYDRTFEHPYQNLPDTRESHGHLNSKTVQVSPFSFFAVPYWWMQKGSQQEIDDRLPAPLSLDQDPPFESSWVFSRKRQLELLDLFFGKLKRDESLVFFYCKDGHPLDDTATRLLVGVGVIQDVPKVLMYPSSKGPDHDYPLWDRLIRHSIRPDGFEGFLLPYHDYLETTGDPQEDLRRQELMRKVAITVPPEHTRTFSYVSEHANADTALSMLIRCKDAIRLIQKDGIAKGRWDDRLKWINDRIAALWTERGAFPGLGSTLEAFGMRLGTTMYYELLASGKIKPDQDPWPVLDAIFAGKTKPPRKEYEPDILALSKDWAELDGDWKNLLRLLSRFAISPEQARRVWNDKSRKRSFGEDIKIRELIENPYRIAELDYGDDHAPAIAVGTIDRGLRPEDRIAKLHPVPTPSRVESMHDPRRIRAAAVAVLRRAAEEGDTCLSEEEIAERIKAIDLAEPCEPPKNWFKTHEEEIRGVLYRDVERDRTGEEAPTPFVQLQQYRHRELQIEKILSARAAAEVPTVDESWEELLIQSIRQAGGTLDLSKPRHASALKEQAQALKTILSRRTTVLSGRAGTGKTSILGALLQSKSLQSQGFLLLAPTGKACVRLKAKTGKEAKTVAKFLYELDRYEGGGQRVLFEGRTYREAKNIIIDEASMLTVDDLYAVLKAIDQTHVHRLILVGDRNQLPPIGAGRPFADFCSYLEELAGKKGSPQEGHLAGALARLTVEVRTAKDSDSDTLKLASWFTSESQPVGADEIFSAIQEGRKLNDLEIRFWKTAHELEARVLETLQDHFGIQSAKDVAGFRKLFGMPEERGRGPNLEAIEQFQILSPVRQHAHGTFALNKYIQKNYRSKEILDARRRRGLVLGEQEIVVGDKVIQTQNTERSGHDFAKNEKGRWYIANGQIGLVVASPKKQYFSVGFSDLPNVGIWYGEYDFPVGENPLELAYALTVHKAQGSEFDYVFMVIPKTCRLLSRELIYTALTRSKKKTVLLIEGEDTTQLLTYACPSSDDSLEKNLAFSENARRNTRLFGAAFRVNESKTFLAKYLIHRTLKGHMVRSRAELLIANQLYLQHVPYRYEWRFDGQITGGTKLPDFLFETPAGEPVIWEHLGKLTDFGYRESWEAKREWYRANGLIEGKNLFTTAEDETGALDSQLIQGIIEKVKLLL